MNKIIIIVAGILIALVIIVVLVWPQYQKLQVLNSDIENKKQELSSQETYFFETKETSIELQKYPDAFAKIASALPKDISLASFANFLQANSAQTGLILKKIVLGSPTAPNDSKGSLKEAQIAVQVSGSYKSFKDFLSLIENSARMIEVQNVSVEVPSEESEELFTFTLDLKITSY